MQANFRFVTLDGVSSHRMGRAATEAFGPGEPLYTSQRSFWVWGPIVSTSVKDDHGICYLWGFTEAAGELWLLANLADGFKVLQ